MFWLQSDFARPESVKLVSACRQSRMVCSEKLEPAVLPATRITFPRAASVTELPPFDVPQRYSAFIPPLSTRLKPDGAGTHSNCAQSKYTLPDAFCSRSFLRFGQRVVI